MLIYHKGRFKGFVREEGLLERSLIRGGGHIRKGDLLESMYIRERAY